MSACSGGDTPQGHMRKKKVNTSRKGERQSMAKHQEQEQKVTNRKTRCSLEPSTIQPANSITCF